MADVTKAAGESQVDKPAVPQAGTPTSQPQEGESTTSKTAEGPAPKVYDEAYVQSLRSESANYRTKLKTLEDAQLSETEKAKRDAAEAKAEAEKLTLKLRDRDIDLGVTSLASKFELNGTVAAALKLIDRQQIQFSDAGQPINLEKILTDLIKEHTFLKQPKAGVTTSQNNPARAGTTLTLEQIKQMSPTEINARWKEVSEVLAAAKGA